MVSGRVERIFERTFTPVVLSVTLLFGFWALAAALTGDGAREVVSYSTQTIERVDPATGVISQPTIAGFDGPAICVGDTVPVRGIRFNVSDKAVPTMGTIVWEQIPPGARIFTVVDVPGLADPGQTALEFENKIPQSIAEMTLTSGEASQWSIVGTVEVFAPDALTTGFRTARFWVVPCD